MKPFRVIVAGGRNFEDYNLLSNSLNKILVNKLPNVLIVSGMANGADQLGVLYASYMNLEFEPFPALWEDFTVEPCLIKTSRGGYKYNALAGHNRNG